MSEEAPLLRVGSLLNSYKAQYLIVGARACWLHGYRTRTWTVSYSDAIATALKITIEGVEVPYLDLQTLIRSKSTEREQDKVDMQRLRSLTPDT